MDRDHSEKELSFLATLAIDIDHALTQASASNTASDRRNALRTIISAMEGAAWIYRTHILSIAQDTNAFTSKHERAFAETSVFITERGEIREQRRFVSTTAMIRLTTKTAQEICPEIKVDFASVGWQNLGTAIAHRNRITHPKNIADLLISARDLEDAKVGFNWFLTTVAIVMEETLKVLAAYNSDAKDLVAKLIAGDPDTIALYERVRREPEK